ncbi:MAG: Tim44/TimA family putative adaptor protein [Pseudomonadota bacterium]
MITEIVILAMIAVFLGLRLYSVLGRRAEHEEESVPQRFESPDNAAANAPAQNNSPAVIPRPSQLEGVMPAVERGVREIASADNQFDITAFVHIVIAQLTQGVAIAFPERFEHHGVGPAREEAGETLENTLIRVEETRIHSASLDGKMARVAVLFVADIAAVTRDKDGNVIAGSLDDAIESRDVWTFSRNTAAKDPNWILDETDEG